MVYYESISSNGLKLASSLKNMKTIYYATHKNIKGNEEVRIEQHIDLLDRISYQVILDSPYTKNDRQEYVIGLFNSIKDAIELADNYKTE
mgnify:CR=1 FL=1